MKSLGLYFGPKQVSLVESDAKKVGNVIQFAIPRSETNILDDKAPDEVKIGQILKDEIKKKNIDGKTVHLSIPGKDFINRTFHMPVLPSHELNNAVRFEAKKYIPFKVEDLAADYRMVYDKANHKNLILFVGIKKDILEKYNGILAQAGLKAESVEYSGLSMMRILQMQNIKERETVAVVYADPVEDDEVNFLVLDDGFPLFSRDIVLSGYAEEGGIKIEQLALAERVEKLKIEVRVSLDYYLRKYPTKNIKKFLFISPPDLRSELEAFAQERSMTAKFIDPSNLAVKPGGFSLGFYRAYAGSVSKLVSPKVKVDLLGVNLKAKVSQFKMQMPAFDLQKIRFQFKYLIIGGVVCGAVYGYGWSQRIPAQQELESVQIMRPRVLGVGPEATLDEINLKNTDYIEKLRNIDGVMKKRLLMTNELDVIPQIIPEGVWFKAFEFAQGDGSHTLTLAGWAYLEDSNKELEAVNLFLTKLKENPKFNLYFNEISLTSVNQEEISGKAVSSFVIICKGVK